MDQIIKRPHLLGIISFSSLIRTLWHGTQTKKTVFGQWRSSIVHNSNKPIQIIPRQLLGNSEYPPLGKMLFWERKESSLAAQHNLSERIRDRFVAVVCRPPCPLTVSKTNSTALYLHERAAQMIDLAITTLVTALLDHPINPTKRDLTIRSFLTRSEWKESS